MVEGFKLPEEKMTNYSIIYQDDANTPVTVLHKNNLNESKVTHLKDTGHNTYKIEVTKDAKDAKDALKT